MLGRVADAIRVTQNTDEAVAFGLAAARILERVVTGASTTGLDAVTAAVKAMQDPARSCGLRAVSSVHALLAIRRLANRQSLASRTSAPFSLLC